MEAHFDNGSYPRHLQIDGAIFFPFNVPILLVLQLVTRIFPVDVDLTVEKVFLNYLGDIASSSSL